MDARQANRADKRNRNLVDKVNRKADTYYNGRRFYVYETPLAIDGIFITLNGQAIDPELLTDGHGRKITV